MDEVAKKPEKNGEEERRGNISECLRSLLSVQKQKTKNNNDPYLYQRTEMSKRALWLPAVHFLFAIIVLKKEQMEAV